MRMTRTTWRRVWLSTAAAASLAGFAAGARAQEAVTIEDVVVTAERREQTLQDIPAAVTAVTGGQLRALGASEFSEYYRTVPGLQVIDRGPGQKKYILRGLNSENAPRLGPIVQQYVDDFPLTFAGGAQTDLRLYDLERVEVLRGPQGTLFGSGSMGGTIRSVTRRPDLDAFGGQLEGTLSATAHAGDLNASGNGFVNLPIVAGRLALRVGLYGEKNAGFIDNVFTGSRNVNNVNVEGGRVQLRWRPVADLTIDLTGLHQDLTSGGLNVVTPNLGQPRPDVPRIPVSGLEVLQSRDEVLKDSSTILNAALAYVRGDFTLNTSSTYHRRASFRQQDASELLGWGGWFFNQFIDHTESHEARLAYDSDRWHAVAGIFYLRNEGDPDTANQTVFQPGNRLLFRNGSESNSEQRAIFGEATFDVTPTLSATVGLRRAQNTADSQGFNLSTGAALGPRLTVKENKTTAKFRIAYEPDDDRLFYAVASQGFRPGGFNAIALDPAINVDGSIKKTYGSDTLWNYELGAKTRWLDGRLTLNGALFYIDWSDIQVTAFDRATGSWAFTDNASAAAVKGVEAEVSFQATDALMVSLSGSYVDARLTEDQPMPQGAPRGGAAGRDGDRLPNVPKWSGSLNVAYERPLAEGLTAFANLVTTYTGASNTFFRRADPFNRVQHSYVLANVRAGVKGEDWRATVFVDNLFDKRAELFISTLSGSNWPKTFINRPRTVGLTVAKDF